jgi:hypothetical protein
MQMSQGRALVSLIEMLFGWMSDHQFLNEESSRTECVIVQTPNAMLQETSPLLTPFFQMPPFTLHP